jgi:adenylyl- and sulfurtransferase ThiI
MIQDLQLGRPAADCRVVVAMSGGVDSACAAALLVEAGCEVDRRPVRAHVELVPFGFQDHRVTGSDVQLLPQLGRNQHSPTLINPGSNGRHG